MKLFRYLAAATIAAVSMSIPALAKVDAGTVNLLETLDDYGITVLYNPIGCGQGWLGQYTTEKVMSICYSGQPDAETHDTVRHETMHVLQHCAALRRGDQRGIVPLAINPAERQQWVSQVLRSGHINQIKSLYPARVHQIELEAFAGAAHYSADQLASLVKSWCHK
jgi:hypothetical protein